MSMDTLTRGGTGSMSVFILRLQFPLAGSRGLPKPQTAALNTLNDYFEVSDWKGGIFCVKCLSPPTYNCTLIKHLSDMAALNPLQIGSSRRPFMFYSIVRLHLGSASLYVDKLFRMVLMCLHQWSCCLFINPLNMLQNKQRRWRIVRMTITC